MRVCRPWLVACVGGVAIGFSLMRLESAPSFVSDGPYEGGDEMRSAAGDPGEVEGEARPDLLDELAADLAAQTTGFSGDVARAPEGSADVAAERE